MTLASFSNAGGLYTMLMENNIYLYIYRDRTVSQNVAIFVGGDQVNNMKRVRKFSKNGV